jgi:uncharacterized protein (TIGR03118 family)
MKIISNKATTLYAYALLCFLSLAAMSCKKENANNGNPITSTYKQVNLVSDIANYGSETQDPDLLNPWGLAIGPTGAFWIADNHGGVTTVYDNGGNTLLQPVTIPFHDQQKGGAPTGAVFNTTTDFNATSSDGSLKKALFIYATEKGTVSIWNGGDSTHTVADRSSFDAVYKGISLCKDGTNNFLYLADFKNAKIDVLDKDFNYVNKTFTDPNLPHGFAPFNIKAIGGKLYVAYAKQKGPDNEDDESGSGNGCVDIFNPDGSFVKRFASGSTLNSPWGIAQVPSGFGIAAGSILIGNFGDGHINIYDPSGNYQGQLMNGANPIGIEGLWEITFENASVQGSNPNVLFFTAGPADETHGLFGYLVKQP